MCVVCPALCRGVQRTWGSSVIRHPRTPDWIIHTSNAITRLYCVGLSSRTYVHSSAFDGSWVWLSYCMRLMKVKDYIVLLDMDIRTSVVRPSDWCEQEDCLLTSGVPAVVHHHS